MVAENVQVNENKYLHSDAVIIVEEVVNRTTTFVALQLYESTHYYVLYILVVLVDGIKF
jgi:hypothetical protein